MQSSAVHQQSKKRLQQMISEGQMDQNASFSQNRHRNGSIKQPIAAAGLNIAAGQNVNRQIRSDLSQQQNVQSPKKGTKVADRFAPPFNDSFFDSMLSHNTFRMIPPSSRVMKIWRELNTGGPTVVSLSQLTLLQVRTATFKSEMHILEKAQRGSVVKQIMNNAGGDKQNEQAPPSQQPPTEHRLLEYGKPKMFYVFMTDQYILFFDIKQIESLTQVRSFKKSRSPRKKGLSNFNCDLGGADSSDSEQNNQDSESDDDFPVSGVDPEYFLDTEFATMRIIKEHSVSRYGFVLHMRGSANEFKFKLPRKREQKYDGKQPSGMVDKLKVIGGGGDFANKSISKQMDASYNQICSNIENNPVNLQEELAILKENFKSWIAHLDRWVIRQESLKKFIVVKEIGVGGQAHVYKIEKKQRGGLKEKIYLNDSPTNREMMQQNNMSTKKKCFAIKVIAKDKLLAKAPYLHRQLMKEIQIQRMLKNCGNALKLYKIYESEKYLNLLMEFQEGGTLGEVLAAQAKLTETDVKVITAQILLSLDFMNQKGLVHRDLKPENVLLNEKSENKVYDIRIADFGFATAIGNMPEMAHLRERDGDEKIVCGTMGYIAPETLEGKGYSIKSDIFSVGSIVFSMLTLRNLFSASDQKILMRLNKTCAFEKLSERFAVARCSKMSCNFVKTLLIKDPARRPTAAQALTHPWFTDEQIPLQSSLQLNKIFASERWADFEALGGGIGTNHGGTANQNEFNDSIRKMPKNQARRNQSSFVDRAGQGIGKHLATEDDQPDEYVGQVNNNLVKSYGGLGVIVGAEMGSCVAEQSKSNVGTFKGGVIPPKRKSEKSKFGMQIGNLASAAGISNTGFNDNRSIYKPMQRDQSHMSGEFQARKEVVSQFNYYQIISSFKKECSPRAIGNIIGSIISANRSISKSPIAKKRELGDRSPFRGSMNASLANDKLNQLYPLNNKNSNMANSFDINLPPPKKGPGFKILEDKIYEQQNMRYSLKSLKRVNRDSISSPKNAKVTATDTQGKGNKYMKRRSKSKFGPKDSRNQPLFGGTGENQLSKGEQAPIMLKETFNIQRDPRDDNAVGQNQDLNIIEQSSQKEYSIREPRFQQASTPQNTNQQKQYIQQQIKQSGVKQELYQNQDLEIKQDDEDQASAEDPSGLPREHFESHHRSPQNDLIERGGVHFETNKSDVQFPATEIKELRSCEQSFLFCRKISPFNKAPKEYKRFLKGLNVVQVRRIFIE
ncbi:hypothetical protein FGO68_gene1963 [Halteria grandinella]|uniref:Protein kinase domain-containing protein n=1 Tax=Halteria grandinella TaxID=5974 RepID=A0A8J8P4K7_HALGN|nr:hypothetical protein FGO68_gene1963 [Halteria grandinella]